MTLIQYRRAVGVLSQRNDVELALGELKKAGFPMNKISLIAREGDKELKDIDGTPVYHHLDNKAKKGLATGAAAGGILGLLVALGSTIIVPGVGHLVFVGTAVHAITTGIAGGTIGTAAGGFLGGLVGMGIPEERAQTYHQQVLDGYYLLIIEGTEAEVKYAEQILDKYNIEEWETYDVDSASITSDTDDYYLRAISVFSSLKNAKTAIIELSETDYPLGAITLYAGDDERHDWFPNLTVQNHLDRTFDRLPDSQKTMFEDCFERNAYIVAINGKKSELERAKSIFQSHNLQSFYAYNPFQINQLSTADF